MLNSEYKQCHEMGSNFRFLKRVLFFPDFSVTLPAFFISSIHSHMNFLFLKACWDICSSEEDIFQSLAVDLLMNGYSKSVINHWTWWRKKVVLVGTTGEITLSHHLLLTQTKLTSKTIILSFIICEFELCN